ncbi:MAG: 50S ribosomal protein L5 [Akkermansia muciniphila]
MGKHPDRKQAVEDAVNEIAKITGPKPSVTYARKSVANFKVREGEPLGARVTARRPHVGSWTASSILRLEHSRLPRSSLQVL